MGLAASRFFLPVTRELLRLQPGERPTDLFDRLSVPKSPGYRIITFYETHNALQPPPTGMVADARKILSLAGGLRADRAVPDRSFVKGPPLEQGLAILENLGVPFALAFQSAANQQAYFEPSNVHQLYIQTPRGREKLNSMGQRIFPAQLHTLPLIAAALMGAPSASRNHRYELFADDLQPLDVRAHESQPPTTGPLQTLLDLATSARTAAHLEFMLEFLRKQGAVHG